MKSGSKPLPKPCYSYEGGNVKPMNVSSPKDKPTGNGGMGEKGIRRYTHDASMR